MGSGSSSHGAGSKNDHSGQCRGVTAGASPTTGDNANEQQQKLDSRLPYANFRELFTLKNYWKTIRRNDRDCSKLMLSKYLKQNEQNMQMYPKLRNMSIDNMDASSSNPGFEALSAAYLKVFDDVITTVEEKPDDVTDACNRLSSVGKMHRSKVSGMKSDDFQQMEEPFLFMISEVLQDRYNDKAENLFRKFYQFCLKYLLEGFSC